MTSYSQTSTLPTFPLAKQRGSRYVTPREKDDNGDILGHSVQIIGADPQALYKLWSDLARIHLWQEHVVSVTPLGPSLSRWVMGNPEEENGKRIEFDSEITEDMPGKKIAWRSITEDVHQSGVVTFELATNGRGTRVTLVQTVKVPGGSLGNAAAAITKRSPRQTVTEDLRHFKQLAETGQIPSVTGQSHGPRGISGAVKEWMYGENNPTPKGTSEI